MADETPEGGEDVLAHKATIDTKEYKEAVTKLEELIKKMSEGSKKDFAELEKSYKKAMKEVSAAAKKAMEDDMPKDPMQEMRESFEKTVKEMEARIQDLEKALGEAPEKIRPHVRGLREEFQELGEGIERTAFRIGQPAIAELGTAVRAMAGDASAAITLILDAVTMVIQKFQELQQTAEKGVQSGQQFETYETQIGSLIKSTDVAKEKLDELRTFSAETPFEMPGITEAYKQLLSYGGQAFATIETLTNVGDAAASQNKPIEQLAGYWGQLRQAVKLGSTTYGEVPDVLSKWGVANRAVFEQMKSMTRAGKQWNEVWDYFTENINQRVGGSMKVLSQTMEGLQSSLNEANRTMETIASSELFEERKASIKTELTFLQGEGGTQDANLQALAKVQQELNEIFVIWERISTESKIGFMQWIVDNADSIISALDSFNTSIASAYEGIKALNQVTSGVAEGVTDAIQPIVKAWEDSTAALKAYAGYTKEAKGETEALTGTMGALQAGADNLKGLIDVTNPLKTVVNILSKVGEAAITAAKMIAIIGATGTAVIRGLHPVFDLISLIAQNMKDLATGDFAAVLENQAAAAKILESGLYDTKAAQDAFAKSFLKSESVIRKAEEAIVDLTGATEEETKANDAANAAEQARQQALTELGQKLSEVAQQYTQMLIQIARRSEDIQVSELRRIEDLAVQSNRRKEDLAKQELRWQAQIALQIARHKEDVERQALRTSIDLAIQESRYREDLARQEIRYQEDTLRARNRQMEEFNRQAGRAREMEAINTARAIRDMERGINEQRIDLERQYQRQLRDIAIQFSRSARDAALANDAIAYVRAKRQLREQREDAKRNYDDQVQDAAIAAGRQRAVFYQQLEDQRADVKRNLEFQLEDMKRNWAIQDEEHQRQLSRQEDDHKLSLARQTEDRQKALARQEEDFLLSQQRQTADHELQLALQEEDYNQSLTRQNDDHLVQLARQEADQKLSLTRQLEDFSNTHQGFVDETAESLKKQAEAYKATYGPDGEATTTMMSFFSEMQARMTELRLETEATERGIETGTSSSGGSPYQVPTSTSSTSSSNPVNIFYAGQAGLHSTLLNRPPMGVSGTTPQPVVSNQSPGGVEDMTLNLNMQGVEPYLQRVALQATAEVLRNTMTMVSRRR